MVQFRYILRVGTWKKHDFGGVNKFRILTLLPSSSGKQTCSYSSYLD